MQLKLLKKNIYLPLNGLNVSRRLEFSILTRYLSLSGGELLLDVACGDGYWTARFARRSASAIGFDYNRNRLLQASKLYPELGGLIGSDAHFLPFKSGIFDAVVGVCVLEHFRDDVKALGELRRVSKLGARLALTVDSFSLSRITAEEKATHAKKYNVAHWYRKVELEQVLRQVGFELMESSYLLKTPLSAALYRAAQKAPRLSYLWFPLGYPISRLSERLSRRDDGGYKLAVCARAV